MKLKIFTLVICSVLLMSCNDRIRKDDKDATSKQHLNSQSQQVLVASQPFVMVLSALTDTAMRSEGLHKLAALNNKYKKNIPLTSINTLFAALIENYPLQQHDAFLYGLSQVYINIDAPESALNALNKLLLLYPAIDYLDKVQFRRAGVLFDMRRYSAAEQGYKQVIAFRNSVFYEQAVYKQGWSQFRQSHYYAALNSFMHLLDVHSQESDFNFKKMQVQEKKFIKMVMRSINLSFDALAGPHSAHEYFLNKQKRQYEYHVFLSLADFYQQHKKLDDAVQTYKLYVQLNELHVQSPAFLLKVIELYRVAGFEDELLQARKDFVLRYNNKHVYWGLYSGNETAVTFQALKQNIVQLIEYYRIQQKVKYDVAGSSQLQRWCRVFLDAFDDDLKAVDIRLLLAESLQKSRLFEMATLQFEKAAYDYTKRPASAQAAYMALLTHEKYLNKLSGFARKYEYKLYMDSAKRFMAEFSQHPHMPVIKSRYAQSYYSNSDYAAAFKLIGERNWKKAALALEALLVDVSQRNLQIEIIKKLAQVYLLSGEVDKAIKYLQQVSYFEDAANHQLDVLWLAAEMSELINDQKQAVKLYTGFIKRFPFPLQRSVEAYQRIVKIYERMGEPLLATQWRVQLVNADANGGTYRTNRTRYLAAKSRLVLARPLVESYRKADLSVPLNESFNVKSRLLNEALKAYRIVASYKVPQVLTFARYQIAELNLNMNQAIIHSERPENLNQFELKQYDELLHQKALTFKHNAIKVYQLNVARQIDGLNDGWIRKSFDQLKELLPEQYGNKSFADGI